MAAGKSFSFDDKMGDIRVAELPNGYVGPPSLLPLRDTSWGGYPAFRILCSCAPRSPISPPQDCRLVAPEIRKFARYSDGGRAELCLI